LFWRGNETSYAELFDATARFAHAFGGWGVRRGQRVLLLLNDTPSAVEVFLAALWMGAIPVLLNPRLGVETLSYILKDSEAVAVVCEPEVVAQVERSIAASGTRARLIVQDIHPMTRVAHGIPLSTGLGEGAAPAFAELAPDEDAYWQYTSGTTGKPKAVRQPSSAMIEVSQAFAVGVLSVGASDRLYSTAKLFFGYGLGNSVFFTLLNGATALLDDRWPTPELILENLKEFHPTVFFSVPALYNALTEHGLAVKAHLAAGARCCSAGSQLPAALFERWKERFDIELLDGIGATEISHIFMCNRPTQARAGSTGVPVEGFQVKLASESGETTETNQRGVLWVRGPSLSLGYANRPEETRERFKDGWYRTGDVFVRREDGHYVYQGREDDLFKCRGRWVAPAELESHVLCHFHEVREAALISVLDDDGLETPALCVVTSGECTKQAVKNLQQHLRESFAKAFESFKCPTRYHFLERLPKNDNGKLMRGALAALVTSRQSEIA
jgi:benzoate-CoA ligase family protein